MTKLFILLSNSLTAVKETFSSFMNRSKTPIEQPSFIQLEDSDSKTDLENEYGFDDCSKEFRSYIESDASLQTSLDTLNISPSISEALNEAYLFRIEDIEGRSKYWLRQYLDEVSSEDLEELIDALKDRGIILEDYSIDEYLDFSLSQLELSLPTYNPLKSCGLKTVSDLVRRSPYWLIKNIDSFNQENINELSRALKRINLSLAGINEDEFVEFKRLQNLDSFIEKYLIGDENLLKMKILNTPKEVLDTDIDSLDLSIRTSNCLKRARINTVGDLALHSKASLEKIKNIHEKSVEEVLQTLKNLNLSLEDENELDRLEFYLNDSSKLELIRESQRQSIKECYDPDYQKLQHDKLSEWNHLKEEAFNFNAEKENNKMEVQLLRSNPPSLKKLEALIGLEGVKSQVSDVIAHTVINKEKNEIANLNLLNPFNMVFIGNPGTGKTTVAKILAEIYKDLSILKSGHLVTATRADLISEYLGQTAEKTTSVFNSALDGILFIDEAYSLFYEGCSPKDYGVDAINTLTGLMSENIGRCCIILAGYPKEMDYLLNNSNPGFRDRFQFIINFDDYDQDSLEQIFRLKLKEQNLKLEDDCNRILTNHLNLIYKNRDKNFSNGRMVSNYLQRIVMNQEQRLFGLKLSGTNLTSHDYFTLKSVDFNDVLEKFLEKSETVATPPLGFASPSKAISI